MSASVVPFLALFAAGVVALQLCGSLPPQPLVLAVGGVAWAFVGRTRFASDWSRTVTVALCAALAGFGYAGLRAEARLAEKLDDEEAAMVSAALAHSLAQLKVKRRQHR